MLQELLSKVGPDVAIAYLFAGLVLICLLVLISTHIVAYHWRQYHQHHLDVLLRQYMLDRGMAADEIERVMGSRENTRACAYPSPSEVVVEYDEEWYPALLLKTDGRRYLIHYKGYDEEEWVTLDRIRFPASPPQPVSESIAEPQHA